VLSCVSENFDGSSNTLWLIPSADGTCINQPRFRELSVSHFQRKVYKADFAFVFSTGKDQANRIVKPVPESSFPHKMFHLNDWRFFSLHATPTGQPFYVKDIVANPPTWQYHVVERPVHGQEYYHTGPFNIW
jgi:hypothetical protein